MRRRSFLLSLGFLAGAAAAAPQALAAPVPAAPPPGAPEGLVFRPAVALLGTMPRSAADLLDRGGRIRVAGELMPAAPSGIAVAALPSPAPEAPAQPAPAPVPQAAERALALAGSPLGPALHPVEVRMRNQIPDEIEPYFDLFLYVSKADSGLIAQRMFAFRRDGGHLALWREWDVSTGRETTHEKFPTHTPEGIFKLDPKRFHARYWSTQWNGEPMPHTMFFDYKNKGYMTGLAIHGAGGEKGVDDLGNRASAGCVRLHPDAARELFTEIRAHFRGAVPAFAVERDRSTSLEGEPMRDPYGHIKAVDGYRVLLVIDDYAGDELVALLPES